MDRGTIKPLENLTIQEWQQLFKANEYCKSMAIDSIVESARIEGDPIAVEDVTAEMIEDYVCGYFCELASLFEENAETDGKEIYITIPF